MKNEEIDEIQHYRAETILQNFKINQSNSLANASKIQRLNRRPSSGNYSSMFQTNKRERNTSSNIHKKQSQKVQKVQNEEKRFRLKCAKQCHQSKYQHITHNHKRMNIKTDFEFVEDDQIKLNLQGLNNGYEALFLNKKEESMVDKAKLGKMYKEKVTEEEKKYEQSRKKAKCLKAKKQILQKKKVSELLTMKTAAWQQQNDRVQKMIKTHEKKCISDHRHLRSTEEIKVMVPELKKTNRCMVCHCEYGDYLEHINSASHHLKISLSLGEEYMKEELQNLQTKKVGLEGEKEQNDQISALFEFSCKANQVFDKMFDNVVGKKNVEAKTQWSQDKTQKI